MAKKGDLWDDSALLNAFDDAISKYKLMHGKKAGDGSNDIEVISSSGDHPVADVDVDHQEDTRQEGADEKSNLPSSTVTEVGESSNPSLVKENHSVDPLLPESYAETTQDVPDYNQLLNQYYELEQKRQQIIEQIHQYGSWNYSCDSSASAMQWANGPTFQEHTLPVGQASNPITFCSCCPYAGQCFPTPCTSVPTCDACEVTDPRKSSLQEDSKIVETAMGAAERAISSLRMKISDNKVKENDKREGAVVPSTSLETDLSEVLNAWYSAGFYTGKYLVEQSITKKRQN